MPTRQQQIANLLKQIATVRAKMGAVKKEVARRVAAKETAPQPAPKSVSEPVSKPITATPTKQQQIASITKKIAQTKQTISQVQAEIQRRKQEAEKQAQLKIKETKEKARDVLQEMIKRGKQLPGAEKLASLAEMKLPPLPEYKPTTIDTETLEKEIENKRTAYEKELQQRLDAIQKEREIAEKQIEAIKATQKGILEKDIEPLLAPWREKLEKSERKRLEIEKNYFANQRTIEEMETLLTQAKQEIKEAESITGLRAIREPRIQKIKEDMQGRIAVLEAVMAARNKQIAVGENLIDRTMDAIQKDRQDRLNYYQTLYNFYQKARDEEGRKLLQLTKDEKEFLDLQTSLIKEDMDKAYETAEYIKKLMTNPQTAEVLERAGVKLTDSVEEINKKLAEDAYRQEIIEAGNKMAEKGWIEIPKAQLYNKPANEVIALRDSRGDVHYYWKEAGEAAGKEYAPSTPYKVFAEGGGEKAWGMSFSEWYEKVYKGRGEPKEGWDSLSTNEKTMIRKWISQYGTPEDLEKVKEDAGFLMWIYSKAIGGEFY